MRNSMNTFKSIHAKLFLNLTLFITPVIIILGISIYYYISTTAQKELLDNESLAVVNISSLLDTELMIMDNISNQVVFSNIIKDNLNKLTNYPLTSSDEVSTSRLIYDTLFSLIGPSFPIEQITIFNDAYFIDAGLKFSRPSADKLRQVYDSNVINQTIGQDGGKYISPTHDDIWDDRSSKSVSIMRLFQGVNPPSSPFIIEVKQKYDAFAKIVSLHASKSDNRMIVFDGQGEIVYPQEEIKEPLSNEILYYYDIVKGKSGEGTFIVKNPKSTDDCFITYNRSDYSGWVVVSVIDEKSLLSSLTPITTFTVIGVFITLAIITIISYMISKKLSMPIKVMQKTFDNINLDTLGSHNFTMEAPEIYELQKLYSAFTNMCRHLKISINEAIQARSRESKAMLLALQSQMNPHFIYNTITTIAAISEEKGQADISAICKQLTDMLRYISTESSKGVTVKEELDQTERYLNLIKMRFESRFIWEINTNSSVFAVILPKLTIQPLVENCVQHGLMKTSAPWKVCVSAFLEDQECRISVKDNGYGFSSEILDRLKKQMEQYSKDLNEGNETPSLQIGGMGLINIYARLKLLFKEAVSFDIYSEKDAGTEVVIRIILQQKTGASKA